MRIIKEIYSYENILVKHFKYTKWKINKNSIDIYDFGKYVALMIQYLLNNINGVQNGPKCLFGIHLINLNK